VRDDTKSNILFLLSGVCLGTIIGLLTAPVPGADTRRKLGTKANEARDLFAGSGREYYDRGRELYDKGRQLADEAAELFEEGRRLIEFEDGRKYMES
jgi:hypothetical protein